ncbi:internal head protein [Citrobacter phage Moon]|uniref:Internal head protein n=1 Tax=Citrobacter phage Moon TaxID=1540095 RepID=A0A0A0YP89_9CAUD|nr:internal head protein [Citrobacter phage Moon]AIX12129.1 hypothetical protein CPT_Moon158 [Citrobacter phage Moon]
MKTYQEFITEAKAPKTFVINTSGPLDDEYATAIINSLTKNDNEVIAFDYKKNSSELYVSIGKGSKSKIKSSFGVSRVDQIDNHDFKQTGVKRQNTIASRGIK